MRRALLMMLICLSLLWFLATTALWLRSESHIDLLVWERWPVQWNLDCLAGELQISRTLRSGAPSWRDRDGFRRTAIKLYGRPATIKEEGMTRLVRHAGGFAYVADDAAGYPLLASAPSPRRLLILPFWVLALLAALPAVLGISKLLRRGRRDTIKSL